MRGQEEFELKLMEDSDQEMKFSIPEEEDAVIGFREQQVEEEVKIERDELGLGPVLSGRKRKASRGFAGTGQTRLSLSETIRESGVVNALWQAVELVEASKYHAVKRKFLKHKYGDWIVNRKLVLPQQWI